MLTNLEFQLIQFNQKNTFKKMSNENQQMQNLNERIVHLETKWAKYANPLKESFARRNKDLDKASWAATLQGMENISEKFSSMSEATQSAQIGSFIQHGYDLITAVYPNLIANQLASIQPLQYKVGEIWFFELQYEKAKGTTGANTAALSGLTGARPQKHYTSEFIDGLVTNEVPNGVITVFTGSIGTAVKEGAQLTFFYVSDGIETFNVSPSDNGVLVGDKGGAGTVTQATGAFSVTFNTAVVTGTPIKFIGRADMDTKSSSSTPCFVKQSALGTHP